MHFSKALLVRGNIEMGLYLLINFLTPVLKIGITLAIFKELGKISCVNDSLIIFENGTQFKAQICLKIRVGILINMP